MPFGVDLPQQETRNQYTGNGITATFSYTYLVPDQNSISVYVTPPGDPANPAADLQTLNVDYTVTGTGELSGGTVVFMAQHIPANGATITLVRDVPYASDTQYSQVTNISGVNLDNSFLNQELQLQQLNTVINDTCLKYEINAITGSEEGFPPPSTYLTYPTVDGSVPMWNADLNTWVSTPFTPPSINVNTAVNAFLFVDGTQGASPTTAYLAIRDNGFPVPTSFMDGTTIEFQPNNTNASNATINVGTLTAPLLQANGTALPAGQLISAHRYWLSYSLSPQGWRVISSGGEGGGVQTVTGNIVDNTNLQNPVVTQVQTDWNATGGLSEILNKPPLNYVPLAGGIMTGVLILDNVLPSSDYQAAPKIYVDSVAAGLTNFFNAEAATTTNLNATYNNGAAGVGATLTNAGVNAAFSTDGYSASLNDTILVWFQTTTFQNGLYTVTTVGDGATPWVLTRSASYDESLEVNRGDYVFVLNGTTYGNVSFAQVTQGTIIIGTTPIVYVVFRTTAELNVTAPLDLVGNNLSINPGYYLETANNLSDLTNVTDAKNNLGAGDPNGLATLDGMGNVPLSQLGNINLALPKGYKSGFDVNCSAINSIIFYPGTAMANNSSVTLLSSSPFTKRLDQSWVSGTGNGGFLPAGSATDGNYYYLFIIAHSDGSTIDFAIDEAYNCPNLANAASFTLYRRIGVFKYIAANPPFTISNGYISQGMRSGQCFAAMSSTYTASQGGQTNVINFSLSTLPAVLKFNALLNIKMATLGASVTDTQLIHSIQINNSGTENVGNIYYASNPILYFTFPADNQDFFDSLIIPFVDNTQTYYFIDDTSSGSTGQSQTMFISLYIAHVTDLFLDF